MDVRLARLEGDAVYLRPIMPPDVSFLYSLATSSVNGFRWRYRGRIPSPKQFEAEIFDGVFQQFVIVEATTDVPVGHVVAYDYDAINGHCFVAVIVDEKSVGSRIGRDALAVFMSYLFTSMPLRKLYAEVPAATVEGVEPSAAEDAFGMQFSIEGTLRQHWFINGRYEDMVLVAIYRANWEAATTA